MKIRRILALLLAAAAVSSFAGCGSEGGVYVQSVSALSSMGSISGEDRFPGMVVSENVTSIKKDEDKTVLALYVKEGDDVAEGQKLFSYDTEELQLNLDKQRLELEQLKSSIENFKSQIETLQNALSSVGGSTKLQYTIEIQSTQVDLKEAELKLKTKEAEVKKSEDLLLHADVLSPVAGRVQAVHEDGGTDRNGNPLPYISIQKSGAFRIKGMLGELQRGAVMEGDRVKILSRIDESQFWLGTVTLVDYENPSQGSSMDQYYGGSSDEMSSSSRYPFYADLDEIDGLLLGQHVYLERSSGEQPQGLAISSAFVCYREDGTAFVWAENRGKLEQRTVELGEFDAMGDCVQILSGLAPEDYVAFPDEAVCAPGVKVTHQEPVQAAAEGA